MFTFTKAPKRFQPVSALLETRLAHQKDGKPFLNINVFDSVDALVKLVEWERITLTAAESLHYAKRLYAFHKRQTAFVEASEAERKLLGNNEGFVPSKSFLVHIDGNDQKVEVTELNAEELTEYAQLTEALARCMLPVGVMHLLSREEFGVPGNGLSDIWQELVFAVRNYAPPMPEAAKNPNKYGFTLTAFVEERLSMKMGNIIDEHEGKRSQLELASLMLKYLGALELNEYAEHDPQVVFDGIAQLLGGTHIWKPQRVMDVDGKPRIAQESYLLVNDEGAPLLDLDGDPIEVARGDEMLEAVKVENPVFFNQRFNSVPNVVKGLAAVRHTKPLRFDGATNNPESGVLGDTIASSQDYDEDDLQNDFLSVLSRLDAAGYDMDYLMEIKDLIAEIADSAAQVKPEELEKWIPMIQATHPEVAPETISIIAGEFGSFKRRHADVA